MEFEYEEYPSKMKAAVLLACLGPDVAGRILSSFSEDEVEQITLDISSLGSIDSELRVRVLDEFYEMSVAKQYMAQGGVEYARDLLEQAFGTDRALEVLTKLQSSLQEVPFEFLKRADPAQITGFIQDEHPQTISLILAHLDTEVSAMILSALANDVQADVVMRIATMDRTPPEIVREVERVLERKMASIFSQGFTFAGGVKEVAEIMNRIDRNAEKTIMADLEERDPELADEIARLMFTFDDVVYVDDAGIQRVLRDVESKDLALALKTANDDVKEKILKNMSARAREMIEEEMEFMGPVRLKNVEEAQQKIVGTIRSLEDSGDLIIEGRGGGGEDEIVV
ncbi:MAG: flagellar motor switch protein FliG [Nitrospiraceae bacterium]|nr:flagellar motor switch protein FliG [Nitrospiraceae bacterium]